MENDKEGIKIVESLKNPTEVEKLELVRVCTGYVNAVINGSRQPIKEAAEQLGISKDELKRIINSKEGKKQTAKYSEIVLENAAIDKIQTMVALKNKAFFNIKDLADFDGESMTFKAWTELPDSVTSAVAEVKRTRTFSTDPNTGVREVTSENVEIKPHNSLKALETLVKILKLGENTKKEDGEVPVGSRLFDGPIYDVTPIETEDTGEVLYGPEELEE